MKYADIINIGTELLNNDGIPKKGLKIQYELDDITHEQLDRELYSITNNNQDFIHNEIIEVNIGGIIFIFTILK